MVLYTALEHGLAQIKQGRVIRIDARYIDGLTPAAIVASAGRGGRVPAATHGIDSNVAQPYFGMTDAEAAIAMHGDTNTPIFHGDIEAFASRMLVEVRNPDSGKISTQRILLDAACTKVTDPCHLSVTFLSCVYIHVCVRVKLPLLLRCRFGSMPKGMLSSEHAQTQKQPANAARRGVCSTTKRVRFASA